MAKRYHSGSYEGMDARRKQEHEDGMMISEDHSAVANLPQHVIMKPFGREAGSLGGNLNDSIAGVDHQMGLDHAKMREHNVPKKV